MRRPFKLTACVLTILLALTIPHPAIAYVSAHTVGADLCICPGLCLHAITRADTQVCPYVVLQTALSGQWAGAVTAGSMSGTLEIAISQEGGVGTATVKMDMGGRQASSKASDLNVTETGLSFTMEFAGANVRFTGKVVEKKISGVLEAIAGGRVVGAGSWTVTRTSTPQPAPENTRDTSTNSGQARMIGEVMEIDRAALRLSVKLDRGDTVAVKLNTATSYLRVSPEESSLEKAAPISLAEVAVGDRVYARGQKSEDNAAFSARQLIVMAKADLALKRERERMAWRQRSVVGVITAVNPNTREIALLMRAPDGVRPLTIRVGEVARFRRYAPDSIKFSDAKPSSFAELRVDDQLRALGEKSADGSRFAAEEIVSGSFQVIGGEVAAINQQSNELTIKELQNGRPVTIVVGKDSLLRRLAPDFATMIADRARRGNVRSRSNAPDPEEAVERMPAFAISDLKPGDRVIVSCVKNAAPARVMAIGLFAGVDPLLKLLKELLAQRGGGGASNLSLGLPMGVL
jgi:hypothetical protein